MGEPPSALSPRWRTSLSQQRKPKFDSDQIVVPHHCVVVVKSYVGAANRSAREIALPCGSIQSTTPLEAVRTEVNLVDWFSRTRSVVSFSHKFVRKIGISDTFFFFFLTEN
jgi:hypothetical protein